jgi:hypothetical protein
MEYLLTLENLKRIGFIHNNTDSKILTVCMRRAQDINVQPTLRTPLYKALLLRVKNNDWTDQNYVTLMNDYVIPCLVAFVDYRCSKMLNEKLTNKSVGRATDENMTANSDEQTNVLRDTLRKDAYFYKERLLGFLKDDTGVMFPEYNETNGTHCHENVTPDRTGYKPLNWFI